MQQLIAVDKLLIVQPEMCYIHPTSYNDMTLSCCQLKMTTLCTSIEMVTCDAIVVAF